MSAVEWIVFGGALAVVGSVIGVALALWRHDRKRRKREEATVGDGRGYEPPDQERARRFRAE